MAKQAKKKVAKKPVAEIPVTEEKPVEEKPVEKQPAKVDPLVKTISEVEAMTAKEKDKFRLSGGTSIQG